MAPGCSMSNEHTQSQIITHYEPQGSLSSSQSTKSTSMNTQLTNNFSNSPIESVLVSCYDPFYLDQIPLPPTPAPKRVNNNNKQLRKSPSYRTLETVDSFEILEQTIMKQKRLGRHKNTDMRMKVLLKRTFNLVCEMMDKENGFDSLANESTDENLESNDQKDIQDIGETLIINLSETESLDLTFQTTDELNYIDLDNFNYENLLENANVDLSGSSLIDKNKSFLASDFFSSDLANGTVGESSSEEESYSRFKRRRSSDDDENDFENQFEQTDAFNSNNSEKSYYLFNDLTNGSGKKRCMNGDESKAVKKFKESSSNSINIVT